MGPGAEAMPCLPAGDGTSHRLRPFRLQRQSTTLPGPVGRQQVESTSAGVSRSLPCEERHAHSRLCLRGPLRLLPAASLHRRILVPVPCVGREVLGLGAAPTPPCFPESVNPTVVGRADFPFQLTFLKNTFL